MIRFTRKWRHSKFSYKFLTLLLLFILLNVYLLFRSTETRSNDLSKNPFATDPVRNLIGERRDTSKDAVCLEIDDEREFPECLRRMEWMSTGWTSDKCFASHGVNGSKCSFRKYLSDVEHFCPPLPGHQPPPTNTTVVLAKKNFDVEELFRGFDESFDTSFYMTLRIKRNWEEWKSAYDRLEREYGDKWRLRKRKKIMIHLGFLTGTPFGDLASKGGPLGEMLQWADLISALHVMGHQLFFSSQLNTLSQNIRRFSTTSACPNSDSLNLIYTDIMGVRHLTKRREFYRANKCRLRVLDSFGTEAQFNHRSIFREMERQLGGKKNPWGGHALNLKQFYTLFPHSHDNTFLGFVVVPPKVKATFDARQNSTLVYGKQAYMWENRTDIVKIASEFGKVYSTVGARAHLIVPEGVQNLGILQSDEVHSWLKSVKVFLGIGFPYEGPAPIEAIANGAVFINAKFSPPLSRLNEKFFADKPNIREFTSQNPYAEQLGEPFVITVDVHNPRELRKAFAKAMSTKFDPFVPVELTPFGMLFRVGMLAEYQDFCPGAKDWPPKTELKVVNGRRNESCSRVCERKGMRCEPSFFPKINAYDSSFSCRHDSQTNSLSNPSMTAQGGCRLQSDSNRFSCAWKPTEGEARRCPCREILDGEVELCRGCF